MISLTQMAYGSRVRLHGRSRWFSRYQRRRSCARAAAVACCGLEMSKRPDPGIAALLSLIVPGVGQIYNGKFLRGIFWLVITPVFWIGSGRTLGWVYHIIAAYTAYAYAKKL